jgi:hypothetical protein
MNDVPNLLEINPKIQKAFANKGAPFGSISPASHPPQNFNSLE